MWVFVGEEGKSSVYHPEIVEMEIMILTALILLVNEVFSGSITDNFFFLVYIHLLTSDTLQIRQHFSVTLKIVD